MSPDATYRHRHRASVPTPSDTAPPAASRCIEARGLSKFYGHVRALSDVSFSLDWGETHALVGDNGAGKSTLVRILSGALHPNDGEVLVDGSPLALGDPLAARAQGIATVYQDLALVDSRSVYANLFLGRELTSRFGFLRRARMRAETSSALEALGSQNVPDADAPVQVLSGGQRQLVAIARGVHFGARILMLDEPTAALGVQETQQILDVVTGLRREDRTVLLISHNLAHVFHLADRITVLRGGRRVGTVRTADTDAEGIVKMITGLDQMQGYQSL
jgi:ABC-type sugar transport system ATPase subunit